MIKISQFNKSLFFLKANFEHESLKKEINKNENAITEYADKLESFIFLGNREKYDKEKMSKTIDIILNYSRDLQIDIESFITNQIKEEEIIKLFIEKYEYKNANLYSNKTNEKKTIKNFYLVNTSSEFKEIFNKTITLSQSINFARNLQIMPPNILNSIELTNIVKNELSKFENLKISILTKNEIKENGMGLLLSVNAGSNFEPRVVIIEYFGNKNSKEITAIIGKGITFDAGGYNIKTGGHMYGMKYDMSGSAIVAGLMQSVAQLKPKSNIVGILMITDNMISSFANLPDSVWKSMNGKTVEINNTDAEGRLVLADGLTYAIRKKGATKIIDIATLTGAVISALGHTYTGVWSTSDLIWDKFQKSAKNANELIWRMPLHNDFLKNMKESKVADLKNTDLSGQGGSSTAAMFLTQFTEGKEYIHLDIAGTANINDEPKAPMIKTLFEFVSLTEND